jgi:hypothetical protein
MTGDAMNRPDIEGISKRIDEETLAARVMRLAADCRTLCNYVLHLERANQELETKLRGWENATLDAVVKMMTPNQPESP